MPIMTCKITDIYLKQLKNIKYAGNLFKIFWGKS